MDAETEQLLRDIIDADGFEADVRFDGPLDYRLAKLRDLGLVTIGPGRGPDRMWHRVEPLPAAHVYVSDASKLLREILAVLESGRDFQLGPRGEHRDLIARIKAALGTP